MLQGLKKITIWDDSESITFNMPHHQARGHLVAQLDPLGIMYGDRTTTISDRKGSPPDEITRQHKLGTTQANVLSL
jgi:hypothetical protein